MVERPTKEKTIISISLKLLLGCLLVGLSQKGDLVGYETILHLVKIESLAQALLSAEQMIISLVSYLGMGCLSASAIVEGKNYFKYARTSPSELKQEKTRIKLEEACKEKSKNVTKPKEESTDNKINPHIIIEGIKDKE